MNIIRWKLVVPVVILLVAAGGGVFLFRDALLKAALIKVGESVFGAKVDIAALSTDLGQARLRLSGVAVADRNDEWKNLFSVEQIEAAIVPAGLLSGRLIVETAQAHDMAFGGTRATSGALARRKPGKDRQPGQSLAAELKKRLVAEQEAVPALAALTQWEDFDVDALLKDTPLKTPEVIAEVQAQLRRGYQDAEAQVRQADPAQLIEQVTTAADDVKNLKISSPQDVAAAREVFSRLRKKKNELEQTTRQLQELQQSVRALGQLTESRQRVQDAIAHDSQVIGDRIEELKMDRQEIARALLGPVWAQRLETGLRVAAFMRDHMPAPKARQKIVPADRGVDVLFYAEPAVSTTASGPAPQPQLLVRHLTVSGAVPGQAPTSRFAGELTHISSDMRLTGEPISARITAQDDEQDFLIEALFDHRQEPVSDRLRFETRQLPVSRLGLSPSRGLPQLTGGTVDIDAAFALLGEQLDSTITLKINDAAFTPASGEAGLLSGALRSVSQFNVSVRAHGAPDALRVEVTSDLDDMVGDQLRGVAADRRQQAQNAVREALQQRYTGQLESLAAELGRDYAGIDQVLVEKLSVSTGGVQQADSALTTEADLLSGGAGQHVDQVKDSLKRLFQ